LGGTISLLVVLHLVVVFYRGICRWVPSTKAIEWSAQPITRVAAGAAVEGRRVLRLDDLSVLEEVIALRLNFRTELLDRERTSTVMAVAVVVEDDLIASMDAGPINGL